MGWNLPSLPTAGVTVATVANWATKAIDCWRYLKGLDGVPTIESGLIIDNTDGDEYLQIPSLTTAERDALTPVNGMVIYNETTTEFNKYEAGAWVDLADNTDHGGLDGLADDDHTIYQKENLLTTAGDLAYATASSTWARLGIGGVAGQLLRTNADLTAPEWASVALTTSSGNYVGDDTENRAIAHGLGVAPKMVFLKAPDTAAVWKDFQIITGQNTIWCHAFTASGIVNNSHAVTATTTTNFYVGNASNYGQSANLDGITYYWVAFG